MARRQPRGGRPSKGDRDQFVTRPPRRVGDEVRERADDADMTISDFIAAVLAKEVGLPELAPLASTQPPEQLEMTSQEAPISAA